MLTKLRWPRTGRSSLPSPAQTRTVLSSPDEAKRLFEAAATLIALAVGRVALDDTSDFVREFDEVDYVTEAGVFERSVDEMLSDSSLGEQMDSPLGGFPG